MNSSTTKYCSICKIHKKVDEYTSYKKGQKSYLKKNCKQCSNLIHRQYYQQNKEKIKEYNKQYREKNPTYNKEYQSNNKEYFSSYQSQKYYYDKYYQKLLNSIVTKNNK